MNKISLKNLNLKEVEQLSREQLKNVLGGFSGGTGETSGPGGSNGDPCPEFCEPMGGKIICTGSHNGVNYVYDHNCNQLDWNFVKEKVLHNYCLN
jgi:hypothetical protein